MADICDITDEVLEREMEAQRAVVAASLANRVKPTGFCLYCDTALSLPEQLYCDHECAEGHEEEIRLKKISGK